MNEGLQAYKEATRNIWLNAILSTITLLLSALTAAMLSPFTFVFVINDLALIAELVSSVAYRKFIVQYYGLEDIKNEKRNKRKIK